jgi:hypothetical protein
MNIPATAIKNCEAEKSRCQMIYREVENIRVYDIISPLRGFGNRFGFLHRAVPDAKILQAYGLSERTVGV